MTLTEHIFYFIIMALFLAAFHGMFRRWKKDGNPQVRFAGQVFLFIVVGMGVGYFWL